MPMSAPRVPLVAGEEGCLDLGMMCSVEVQLLSESQTAELRRRPLTHGAVGQAMREPPPGYGHFSRARYLPVSTDFDQVAADLMSWQVQARSGLRVAASSREVELDEVVLMHLGFGRVSIAVPCRVVTVVRDIDVRGFAYGTLTGHPESGEEAFLLKRHLDGSVEFTITAFSRPSTALARAGGPITKRVQRWMTDKYLHALD